MTRGGFLANSGNRGSEVEHFLDLSDRVYILRSVGGSLRCLPLGITSYADFRTLLSLHFMPPTEKSVLAWIATFAPGSTFMNYPVNLRKGRSLLGASPDWATNAVYAASEGLRKSTIWAFKSPNFLFVADISNLVDFLGWGREFAPLAFISFLFPLSVHPDALPLRGAFRDDPIGVAI